MKVGVLKLGARVSFSSQGTSGGTGEAISIINMLKRAGHDVVVFTKILKKDELVNDIEFRQIETEHEKMQDLDCLMVINGTVNFFGGAEDPSQLYNYVMINSYKGPVYYVLCDPDLTLKQIATSVSAKPWGKNWPNDKIKITRADITYICQPLDLDKVKNSLGSNEVKPARMYHFPFEKFPCFTSVFPYNENPDVDLSYGGTMRGGRRVEKMIKFYFGHSEDISVEMFGKINLGDFFKIKKVANAASSLRAPMFTGPVKYDMMQAKMNNALTHCVIGDPWYEAINDVPQRTYESIWSSVVTFIDDDLDEKRRVYGKNKTLSDFLYVSSRDELTEKIRVIKNDTMLRKQIIAEQFAAVDFDPKGYCDQLSELLK